MPWNHSIWLLSEVGNNGKGTLCRLMRNLLGDGAHTSINLKQFTEQFGLDDLLNASATNIFGLQKIRMKHVACGLLQILQ
ncbi:hypothetical protein QP684_07070 [Alloscardovia omnicolens]|nr:hypothetical protein [Alloscardovia omnicolens]